jgi:hypothetical protein
MYIETVPNRNSPSAILLREGWREGNKTRKRTLANLSHRPKEKIETLRRWLRDEPLVSPQDLLATRKTLPHGHVEALLLAIRKLGLDAMISAKPCRERDLVLATIVERWLDPRFQVGHHAAVEQHHLGGGAGGERGPGRCAVSGHGLAVRATTAHREKTRCAPPLRQGSRGLYDVRSSDYEGHHGRLAQYGHDRDGQKGLPIIVYGLMTIMKAAPSPSTSIVATRAIRA